MIIIISIIFNILKIYTAESVQAGCFKAKQNVHYILDLTNERMIKRTQKRSLTNRGLYIAEFGPRMG